MCPVPLNPVLHLLEWPWYSGRGQCHTWRRLPWPASWRTLATLVPLEQVTGFSSEPWASEGLWHPTPTHPTSCEVSGLALPLAPPASSDENLDREARSIDLDACTKHMSCGLSYVCARPWWGRQAAGSLEELGLRGQSHLPVGPRAQPPSCLHPVLSHSQHILYCIVDSECKSRDVLQSYFDLLGELMKFNVDAFKRFNKYINTDAKVRLTRAPWGLLRCPEPWSSHSQVLVLNWRILGADGQS